MENKAPFIYPDYIVHTLTQLMERSVEDKDGLLCKTADIISVLYNQFNDFPVTEQVYTLMWKWLYKMAEAGSDDWLKRYWNIANQYYMFKLEYSDKLEMKDRFREFHIMACTLLLYKERYNVLIHAMTFTNTFPPQYPLIPSTFADIFQIYNELSVKNQRMYLMRYSMDEVFIGAGEEHKIEELLADYLALLLVRLYTIGDYNVIYSNPLGMPETDETIEDNDFRSALIDNLERHLNKLSENRMENCNLDSKQKARVFELFKAYKEKCNDANKELEKNADISKEKRQAIKDDLINQSSLITFSLPLCDKKMNEDRWHTFIAHQQITLDKRQILDCYNDVNSNLGEAIIKSLHLQMQRFYSMQFLLNSAVKSLAIPYCDLERILKKLSLTSSYSLLMMGISSSLFDEINGFIRKGNKIYYGKSYVHDVPYSSYNPAILIMKNKDVPCCSYKEISSDKLKDGEREINVSNHLYANIDTISINNLTLTVKQCLGVFIPNSLRYIRLRIAYQLEPDDMIVSRIEPINYYLP